ncbi:hypothetical protein ARMGADRAFT_284784 [Armillaria gallica]|uniref:Uncharacterized protein n=1 Tax=Armillaria gallica TaxID=47427 RepID=A0A2H3D6Y0_ARMGA|nr:hypothetical protein ARMGADRAFT_284784 [Armillaria gallica]
MSCALAISSLSAASVMEPGAGAFHGVGRRPTDNAQCLLPPGHQSPIPHHLPAGIGASWICEPHDRIRSMDVVRMMYGKSTTWLRMTRLFCDILTMLCVQRYSDLKVRASRTLFTSGTWLGGGKECV